jgi:NAD(P)-dependent dehydrogenase (short-subunit alcohol dehydrogenase family)
MRDGPLAGRVAIVTGASSGIGAAAARALAAGGADVMAVARRESELARVAQADGIEYLVAAVDDRAACERIVAETRKRLGPIAILVNNAGRGGFHDRPIWEQDEDGWQRTMRVNLDAPFWLTQFAVPDMIQRRSGRIVMVSSTAAVVAAASMSAYSASKSGLLGLMRSVAQDVGTFGITCNAVLPGWVRTEMAERDAEQEAAQRQLTVEQIWDERAESYPAGRVVEPREVADVIALLVSDQASGVNGEAITVALGSAW